ncbi:hypothetical protein G9A89_000347, partial [Geosiphon pyriformis]
PGAVGKSSHCRIVTVSFLSDPSPYRIANTLHIIPVPNVHQGSSKKDPKVHGIMSKLKAPYGYPVPKYRYMGQINGY